jgi:hypothetical protein
VVASEEKKKDNAEFAEDAEGTEKRNPRAQAGVPVPREGEFEDSWWIRRVKECVAPPALEEFFAFVPSPYGLG